MASIRGNCVNIFIHWAKFLPDEFSSFQTYNYAKLLAKSIFNRYEERGINDNTADAQLICKFVPLST